MLTQIRVAARTMLGLILGFGLAGAAQAQTVTPSLGPSRTAGPAPLAVFFDATGTTCQGCGDPFHDLHYEWSFGDAANGAKWALTGRSKNLAFGPTSAHVFEQPGSYTVTLKVTGQSGGNASRTVTITVGDPNQQWAGARTVCVSTSGNFTGCPGGAQQVTTNSLATAAKSCNVSNTRCLFRRGEVWNGEIRPSVAGPNLIGAFGSGARPRFKGGPTMALLQCSGSTDWRIMDLEFEGSGTTQGILASSTRRVRDLLIFRTNMVQNTFHAGVNFAGNNLDLVDEDIHDGVFLVENDWKRVGRGAGGNIVFMAASRQVYLGNDFQDTRTGEHVMRIQHGEKGVISNNLFADQANTKGLITLRSRDQNDDCSAGCGRPSKEFVLSDNIFRGRDDINVSITGLNRPVEKAFGRNFIVERNFFTKGQADAGLQMSIKFEDSEGITLRNNVLIMDRWETYRGFEFSSSTRKVKAYNNSCFVPTAATVAVRCVRFTGTLQVAEAFNNILYAPGTSTRLVVEGAATASGANQVPDASPFIVAAPTKGEEFALRSGTAAIGSGVRVPNSIDYASRPRGTGTPDVGAFAFGNAVADLPPQPPVLISVDVLP
jgi:PKD repeat protein